MFNRKKLRTSNAAAEKAISTGREAAEVARKALELYRDAQSSEEAALSVVEVAVESGDLEHVRAQVAQLREELNRYRAREDAADLVHRLGWTSL